MSLHRNEKLFVIMPAYNEEDGVPAVLNSLFSLGISFEKIVLVDNASDDQTAERARDLGAHVVYESKRGYGAACLKGIEVVSAEVGDDTSNCIVVFLDADYSDYPEELPRIIGPILEGTHDFVLGSRLRNVDSANAVPFVARFGNMFASKVMQLLYGVSYTDMGPFRALTFDALKHLNMQDQTWGWTLEMQMKAAQANMRILEVPVRYRERAYGKSKISQSFVGATRAASKILFVMAKYGFFGTSIPSYPK